MTERGAPRLSARLWPQVYGVVHLTGAAARVVGLPAGELDDPPSMTLRRGDGVTFIATLEQLSGTGAEVSSLRPWRALTLEGIPVDKMPHVLKNVAAVLNEVGTQALTVSTSFELLLLIPDELLGRALAALAQARLERLL